ncbi:ABC-2 transporter permease [Tissierella sp. MSJ-40]|uniref:ABC-2 transporter permease n=1 Tax=Tissierella simiarum TaxID=2841534 RepID=A0ABS6EAH6_9FIRM|nr:ABC-2 transporter permease [Tissierella simiarum]MBU5439937.1 ABC-2 transporter permease [Tissierella simiarum]
MKNLVMKDLRLTTKMNIFALLYGIIIGFTGLMINDVYRSKTMYIVGMSLSIYIVAIYTSGFEGRAKSDIILNSFPINRIDIVKAKYVSMIIYIILGGMFIIIPTQIFKLIGSFSGKVGNPASLFDFLFVLALSLIFYSIYLPFYYKSDDGLRTFNQVFYMIMIIIPGVIGKLGKKIEGTELFSYIIGMDLKSVILILLGLGVVLYIISLQISKQIYLKREF